tara:strand:- start:270 stop:470 length:201 start_codon:yes stop_codon:yes gene_type:complete
MNEMDEDLAFKIFRRGELSKLDFIPNIQELRDNFGTAMNGKCCQARGRTVLEHRNIFLAAFRAATQ